MTAIAFDRPKRFAGLTIWAVRQQFLNWSGSWWFALTIMAGQVVVPLIGLFIWSAVLPGNTAIVDYYVALVAVQLLTASFENHTIAGAIYDGNVSHQLLKPQPVVLGPMAENLAIRIWLCLTGLPLVLATALLMRVSYAPTAVLLAVPAVMLAMMLAFLFTWTLAMSAFWTERVHAVCAFGSVLIFVLGGSAAPVMLVPEPFRTVVEMLPFRAMLGFPAELATHSVSGADVLLGFGCQLGWGIVLAGLAIAAWRAGVRRYTAVGS